MNNKQTYCKSCGAPIKYIKTPAGKFMPVDAQEVTMRIMQGGRYRFVLNNGQVVSGEYARPFSPGAFIAYEPHWGNCKAAEEMRRSKRGGK